MVLPGEVVISDHPSVFCTGAMGAIPLRLSSAQVSSAKQGLPIFVRIPPCIRVNIESNGEEQAGRGIDAALAAWHVAGSGTLLGAGVELGGSFFANASPDARTAVAGFGALMGAATLFVEPDLRLLQDIRRFCDREFKTHTADRGTVYAASFSTVLSKADYWALSDEFTPLSSAAIRGTPIDRVVVAGPGGGSVEHLSLIARMVRGRSKHAGVELTIQPESPSVEERARRMGVIGDLEKFGAKMIPSGMTAPLAKAHDRVLAVGVEAWLAARKIEQTEVWLAGPHLAAAAALTGTITEPGGATAPPPGDSKVSARHGSRPAGLSTRTPDQKGPAA
jgi:aconitate hydratase